MQSEELEGVFAEDVFGQALGVGGAEVFRGNVFFHDFGEELAGKFHRAVGFFDMPIVAADHHAGFVGQHFDGFMHGEFEMRWTEQERPGQVEPDVSIDEGHAKEIAAPRIGEVHQKKTGARMTFDQAGSV